MFSRLAVGIFVGAALAALAAHAEAGTSLPVRWNTGGAVWTTTSSEFKTFCETDDVTDRALDAGVNNSGWTAEEIQWGMTKRARRCTGRRLRTCREDSGSGHRCKSHRCQPDGSRRAEQP